MALSNNGRHACLTGGLTNVAVYVSLHSDIPNSSGNNELTGGTYARVGVTWNTPASGAVTNNGALSHNVPAGATVAYYGLWSASTSGTFYGSMPLNGTVKGFATAATDDTITSNAHGLSDTNRIVVLAVAGESLPTGLSASTIYYVVSSTTNTFKVSLTSGGSAVDITAVGELFFQKVVPEVYGSAGTLSTADTALSVDLSVL